MDNGGRFERKYPTPKVGDRYGELVIRKLEEGAMGGIKGVVCECSCGWVGAVALYNLRKGASTRCDSCAKKRSAITRMYLPSMSNKDSRRLLGRLNAALSRCHNPLDPAYPSYGGRGIGVYPAWHHDKKAYLEYVTSIPGWDDPKLTIDRIDVDDGYVPGNIRFISLSEQQWNKRTNVWIEYKGERMLLVDFHSKFCPHYAQSHTITRKLREGKTLEQIILEQKECRGKYKKQEKLLVEFRGRTLTVLDFWREFCPQYAKCSTVKQRILAGESPEEVHLRRLYKHSRRFAQLRSEKSLHGNC